MTRTGIFTAVFVTLALGTAPTQAQPKEVVFLHTNDMHAGYYPHEAMWVKGDKKPLVGGFLELAAAVDSLRAIYPGALLLDAGDVMTGNPVTEYDYRGARGGVLFEMMNMIGYDLWTPGNHDFDVSQENLRALTRIARFPTINANVVNDRGELAVSNAPYQIVERNGLKIGIIGIMSQGLYGLVNQNNLVGIRVKSPIETTQKYIDELESKTDLIVALTHQGADEDSALAKAVQGAGHHRGGALAHAAQDPLRGERRADGAGRLQRGEPGDTPGDGGERPGRRRATVGCSSSGCGTVILLRPSES